MLGRIGIFSHTPPSITRGGAEISAYTLYSGLRQLGFDAVFVSACPAQEIDKVLPGSANEHVIPYDAKDYDDFYHLAPSEVVDGVERLVTRLGCELLFFHHFLFFGLNTLRQMTEAGRTVVLTLHEYLSLCYHQGQMVTRPELRLCQDSRPELCIQCFPERRVNQFDARRKFILDSLRGVSAFVSPSHFLAERCKGWGFPQDRFFEIENGLLGFDEPPAAANLRMRLAVDEGARHRGGETPDLSGEPNMQETAAHADKNPLVLGFFGQINPFKGMDVLLDAATRLVLATGPQQFQIRVHGKFVGMTDAFTAQFNEAVTHQLIDYRGAYDNTAVLSLMRDCDFIIMASHWWENSPVVIQEAFWAKRPLIVPGIGGMAEKVKDGVNGFHFRPGDGADLARVCRLAATWDRSTLTAVAPASAKSMARSYLATIGVSTHL